MGSLKNDYNPISKSIFTNPVDGGPATLSKKT